MRKKVKLQTWIDFNTRRHYMPYEKELMRVEKDVSYWEDAVKELQRQYEATDEKNTEVYIQLWMLAKKYN